MNSTINKFYEFIQNLKHHSVDLKFDRLEYEKIKKEVEGKSDKLFVKDLERRKNNISRINGFEFPSDHDYLFYLSSLNIRWYRPELKSMEGLLSGGTYINGIIDAFQLATPFWEKANQKFNGFSLKDLPAIPLNNHWIESPASFLDAEYAPQYGCFEITPNHFPDKFNYFDSGILHPLPFNSFENYFSALINTGMVKHWQYFYIAPKEIIARNKNLPYLTLSLHRSSNLHKNIRNLAFDESIIYDRLDLIMEHLEKCIRLLPKAFPFLDFSYHENHVRELTLLYEEFKEK